MFFFRALFAAYILSLSPIAAATTYKFGPRATEKAKYYVCPDGRTARRNKFQAGIGYGIPSGSGYDAKNAAASFGDAKIFIGKLANSYTKQEMWEIHKRFLYYEITTPGAYASKKVEFTKGNKWYKDYTIISFENSDGKSIKFSSPNGGFSYEYITDSKGNEFRYIREYSRSEVFCIPEKAYFMERIVDRISLRGAMGEILTDQFGYSVPQPLMFMVINFYVKSHPPTMQISPSF